MMKKRLVCQFLAAAMLLGLLAGCGPLRLRQKAAQRKAGWNPRKNLRIR